eukprot:3099902-Rhodomonas_salina.1
MPTEGGGSSGGVSVVREGGREGVWKRGRGRGREEMGRGETAEGEREGGKGERVSRLVGSESPAKTLQRDREGVRGSRWGGVGKRWRIQCRKE